MSALQREQNAHGLLRLLSVTSIFQLLGWVAIGLFARFIVRGIYRLYFHPLSRFPGPRSRAFTRIPHLIAIWTGTNHWQLEEMHRKYGHIVRVMPDELSVTEPNAWKDIYGHGTKGTQGSPPPKDYEKYGKSPNGAYNLLSNRDEDHSRVRKIFTPAFSDRALKQQEPLFLRYANKLVFKIREAIEQDPNKKIDMVIMYNFTTFDVMGDLTFGEPFGMLDKSAYDPWVSTIFRGLKFGGRLSVLRPYKIAMKIFRFFVPNSVNTKRASHFNHTAERVQNRLEKGRTNEGVDLWDLVLKQKEGRGLTRGEMDANAALFMLAGTETTATLLAGLTYMLLKNPETMAKLTHEIRSSFSNADDMKMENLAALPYLAACIKEAFRLYPPVPLGMPRLTPQDGSTVSGTYIPPNTCLVIPQLAMYTNEKNFRQPFDYIPDRWLGDPRFDSDEKQALQPFSVGSRDCVGKNMAYHEMRLIIAKILYNFDLELCPESDDWKNRQNTFILWQKIPLLCKVKVVN